MINTSPLGGIFRSNILALQKASRLIDTTTLRLATGLKVNSALDNPQNFFNAMALNNRSSDFSRRLDGINQSIRTVQEGLHGVEAIEDLLNLAESNVVEELERFRQFGPLPPPPPVTTTTTVGVPATPLDVEILADNPAAYWRLNEGAGTAAGNLGSIGGSVTGTYTNGPTLNAAPLFPGGSNSVDFNGANQYVAIPDSNQINTAPQTRRSMELVFNADTTAGRQVLYEEGGGVNALSIYIFNGRVHVTGRDAGAWGPANISAPIVAGQTYHVAFTLDSTAGEFIGYVDGAEIGRTAVTATFPSHSNNIAIGRMSQDTWFHDGVRNGNGFYYNGRISDVALYNATLTPADIAARAVSVSGGTTTTATTTVTPPTQLATLNKVLDQIDLLTVDASYRGVNLLGNDDLLTLFNEDGSNNLRTKGVDFTSNGLGISRTGLETEEGVLRILDDIRRALKEVRLYGSSLVSDLSILTTRQDFTRNLVNTLKSGADDLTLADMNEEGANLLALQTRQSLAVTSLSIANISNASILNLFA